MFGRQKTAKEQLRETKKEIRHNERDMDRELQSLTREEAKLIIDIKKAAASGQHGVLKIMAKNLVQLRAQKDRLVTMKATITGVGYKASLMQSQMAVGHVMGTVAGVSRIVEKFGVDRRGIWGWDRSDTCTGSDQ
jgi:hypothetical protein|eukprot:evm.model.NODE_32581_length_16376_cov_18.250671.7